MEEAAMEMAPKVQDFLETRHADYAVLDHRKTYSSCSSAQASHVPERRFAKAVLVKDGFGYLLAILPATRHVDLPRLAREIGCETLRLAMPAEAGALFRDCQLGALPPIGEPYGVRSIIEEDLDLQPELFFEAGDHRHVVHLTRREFARLTGGVPRAHFSTPATL